MKMIIKSEYMAEFYKYVESNLSSFEWIEHSMYADRETFFGQFILVFYVNEEDKKKIYNDFIKPMQEKELKKIYIYINIFLYFGISSLFIFTLITFIL